ncbi:unnamed protein product [Sphagnum balticum]
MGFRHNNSTFLVLLLLLVLFAASIATPLDDYILKEDSNYRWYDTGGRLKGRFLTGGWEGVVLNMTSQGWLSPMHVDCFLWTHSLVILKPHKVMHPRTSFLLIGQGSNTNNAPKATDQLLLLAAALAVRTNTIAAVLYQVPNQPCGFSDDEWHPRSEDDIIAYTWAHFIRNPEEVEWPLHIPMTKAAVRAMDTLQTYACKHLKIQIESFVVAGASKRGWTTWLTAAVDKRVVGIAPIVMDALQFVDNLHHYYKSFGGWPWSFEPYQSLNLTTNLDSPEFSALMGIEDPYVYLPRLTMPKLIVTSSNDEFFLLDDSSYFWNEMIGEKHLLILSNTDHSLLTGLPKLLAAMKAFVLSIVLDYEKNNPMTGTQPNIQSQQKKGFSSMFFSLFQAPEPQDLLNVATRISKFFLSQCLIESLHDKLGTSNGWKNGRPNFWWTIDWRKGRLEILSKEMPSKSILWYAYTNSGNNRRDFRWVAADLGNCSTFTVGGKCFQPIFFHHQHIQPVMFKVTSEGNLKYVATIPFPKEGYGAFFVELRFKGPQATMPFIFTTEAIIVPNTFPFPDCHGTGCTGTLV